MSMSCRPVIAVALASILVPSAICYGAWTMNHPLPASEIPSVGTDGTGNTPNGGEAVEFHIRTSAGTLLKKAAGTAEQFGGWYLDIEGAIPIGINRKAELWGNGSIKITHHGLTVTHS